METALGRFKESFISSSLYAVLSLCTYVWIFWWNNCFNMFFTPVWGGTKVVNPYVVKINA